MIVGLYWEGVIHLIKMKAIALQIHTKYTLLKMFWYLRNIYFTKITLNYRIFTIFFSKPTLKLRKIYCIFGNFSWNYKTVTSFLVTCNCIKLQLPKMFNYFLLQVSEHSNTDIFENFILICDVYFEKLK